MLTFTTVYDSHRNNFDFVRFLLASTVIWSHCYPLYGKAMDPIYALSRQTNAGTLAVDSFFIVSGFLVAQSWLRAPAWPTYIAKRCLRILPGLLCALFVAAFVLSPLAATRPPIDYLLSRLPYEHFYGVVLHRFLSIPGVFATNPLPYVVNAPLWSLRYELLCYAFLPLLLPVSQRRATLWLSLTLLFAWLYYLMSSYSHAIPGTTARLVACFTSGALYHVHREHIPYRRSLFAVVVLVLSASLVLGGFRPLYPLLGPYAICYVAFLRVRGLGKFGYYGDFSYGLYIYAYPIQQLLLYTYRSSLPFLLFFPASLLAALIVAMLSWHFVERPALRKKPMASRSQYPPRRTRTGRTTAPVNRSPGVTGELPAAGSSGSR